MPRVFHAMLTTLWPSNTLGINWGYPRDQLGVQSFPNEWKDCLHTFQHVTTRPFGYMFMDLHPASSDQRRLYAHVLKDEGWTRTYIKRSNDGQ